MKSDAYMSVTYHEEVQVNVSLSKENGFGYMFLSKLHFPDFAFQLETYDLFENFLVTAVFSKISAPKTIHITTRILN